MFYNKGNKKFEGLLKGESHENGGIKFMVGGNPNDIREAEGNEFVVKTDSVNPATLSTLEYINEHGDLPLMDARDRSEVI
jgi:hypothetical protein